MCDFKKKLYINIVYFNMYIYGCVSRHVIRSSNLNSKRSQFEYTARLYRCSLQR